MEKVARVVRSFAESDRLDRAYYHSLTPHQRIDILLELNQRSFGVPDAQPAERLPRVYRVIKFS